jgi:hypothetical protein
MSTDDTTDFAWGGWDAARNHKHTLGLRAAPAERLAWLESMIELAWSTGALPRPRRDPWGTRTKREL